MYYNMYCKKCFTYSESNNQHPSDLQKTSVFDSLPCQTHRSPQARPNPGIKYNALKTKPSPSRAHTYPAAAIHLCLLLRQNHRHGRDCTNCSGKTGRTQGPGRRVVVIAGTRIEADPPASVCCNDGSVAMEVIVWRTGGSAGWGRRELCEREQAAVGAARTGGRTTGDSGCEYAILTNDTLFWIGLTFLFSFLCSAWARR